MKILQIVTRSIAGGAQTVIANLSNDLVERGHDVMVVAGEGDGNIFKLLDRRINSISLPSLKRALSVKEDLVAMSQLRKIYKKYNPDVIHLHSSKVGILGRLIFPSKKIVYTVHGFDSVRLAFPLFLPIEKLMQYFCRAIVGVSKYDETTLRQCGIRRNVIYIYNGIRKLSVTPSLKWPVHIDYKHKVLCIARLSPQKNHHLFIDIAREMPEIAFIWIGNQIPIEDVPDNVFFFGNISEAGKYCQLADIFILTSNYEGLPMVILEAMSLGKPVISSKVGGVSEIVIDNYTGYAVDNNVSDFVCKINQLISNRELYEDISRNSLLFFEKNLTQKVMVDKYLNIYKNIYDE